MFQNCRQTAVKAQGTVKLHKDHVVLCPTTRSLPCFESFLLDYVELS